MVKKVAKRKEADSDYEDDAMQVEDNRMTQEQQHKEKTIEEIYQKKTPIEHILIRPDTFIGAVEKTTQPMWIFDTEAGKMVEREVTYVPGLFKIFDEILVNAIDNHRRDPTMDTIKVDINAETGAISVWNNGKGIPVEIHKEERVYVPELIFGHLLTGSNFDDTVKRITGGRNGYGAKLTNIFSKEFTIETFDSERGKKFKQVYKDNMSVKSEPTVTSPSNLKNDYTLITFKPDFARFDMTHLDEDTVLVLTKRVYDVAGVTDKSVKVVLNGTSLKVKTFQNYVDLYLDKQTPKFFETTKDGRWTVCVTSTEGAGFQQVSFVNGICTSKGGFHVNHVTDQIIKSIKEVVAKKAKGMAIKPAYIKNNLFVFVNSLIENPAFDSQTKEYLSTQVKKFGSRCALSDEFIAKLAKSSIVQQVLEEGKAKAEKSLSKTDGTKKARLTGITKLDDANDAGGRNAEHCTLILTEGDSAKSLAVSGLSVVGRDRYGVYPLKGKLLNVRDAASSAVAKNKEIQELKQILGLKQNVTYDDIKKLRYGSLMIMTDQDHDGSHIKGLIINFIHKFWPSLLQRKGFLKEFITPIVKATKGNQEIAFFTIPEYENWKRENNTKGWKIKYYKGLGTSTSKEAKEYFRNIDTHQIDFTYDGPEDDACIEKAFAKSKVEDRKSWLREFKPGTYVDHSITELPYTDFVNKELILFSVADNIRSIPSLIDGLKPGQRKILFGAFQKKVKEETKVQTLAAIVSKKSAYHHGENSLCSTIVGMAQNFVGANNINLLYPGGQFGSRLNGGKDAASARYIHTRLSHITRYIFRQEDDAILTYLDDDGQSVEPKWYVPIIPMCLVNGSEGIGTGWSTSIPNFNPREIVQNIKNLLDDKPVEVMHPWYKGFLGEIKQGEKKKSSYSIHGKMEKTSDTTLEITELPVGSWTQDHKELLEKFLTEDLIQDYREYHTDTSVHFKVKMTAEQMKKFEAEGLEKKFKMVSKMATSNMNLFLPNYTAIQKYETPMDIIKAFYEIRLEYYDKRKAYLVEELSKNHLKLQNCVRFIKEVINEQIILKKKKKDVLMQELFERKYDQFPANRKGDKAKDDKQEQDDEDQSNKEDDVDNDDASIKAGGYNYLLSMPLWNLTFEKVEKLEEELMKKEKELNALLASTSKDIWRSDLDEFLEALEKFEQEEEVQNKKITIKGRATKGKGRTAGTGRQTAARKKAKESDDDFEEPKKKKVTAKRTLGKKTTKAAAKEAKEEKEEVKKTNTKAKSTVDKMDTGSDDEKAKEPPKKPVQRGRKKKESTLDEIWKKPVDDTKPEEEMTLQERLAKRAQQNPTNNSSNNDTPKKGTLDNYFKKVSSPLPLPLAQEPTKKRGRPAKKAVEVEEDEVEESVTEEKETVEASDEEKGEEIVSRKNTVKKRLRKTTATTKVEPETKKRRLAKKKTVEESEEEESIIIETLKEDSDEPVDEPKTPRTRAKSKPVYVEDSFMSEDSIVVQEDSDSEYAED